MTSSGVPDGDDLAEVEGDHPVGDRREQRHVVLDDQQARAGHLADAQQQRAERLGLPLRDARRRLVEQQHARAVREHAREVDDAPAAGRQLADVLVAERAEPEQLDQLLDPRARPSLRSRRPTGRCSAAAIGSRTSMLALERDRDRLARR